MLPDDATCACVVIKPEGDNAVANILMQPVQIATGRYRTRSDGWAARAPVPAGRPAPHLPNGNAGRDAWLQAGAPTPRHLRCIPYTTAACLLPALHCCAKHRARENGSTLSALLASRVPSRTAYRASASPPRTHRCCPDALPSRYAACGHCRAYSASTSAVA